MTRYGFDLNETFVPETRHLPIEQFKLRDPHKVDKDWKIWLEEIEREFRYFRTDTPTDKKDALIIFGGREISYLEQYLSEPDGKLDEYQKLRKKLNTFFAEKKNQVFGKIFVSKNETKAWRTNNCLCSTIKRKSS